MIYRELGGTGLRVSQLGFGAMRLPTVGVGEDIRVDREAATRILHYAFEAGVIMLIRRVSIASGGARGRSARR